jgi:quercetin dioxygenase-like cupin family protein
VAVILLAATAIAQESSSAKVFQTELGDLKNQEMVVLTVTYPPGVASAEHRHNSHTFVYVLEGSVVMQVEGGDEMTLGVGEHFYETPADVHTVSRNASDSEPATILVVFVKKNEAPLTVPAD